ncbi:Origin recognition complex subunit 3-like [Mycena indigotica]|uniref:Origin recognition complex subunit 3-like n=1 Tax=Mycena indigotica TaxID=2126181 RepID=A0A8H6W3L7_9AGAR|nr:Origin recognition complex subunit 3-like [Mycena indigotica]KAF7303722.1 Origin recognition complex subunit 3-like [Mycena indigotica]
MPPHQIVVSIPFQPEDDPPQTQDTNLVLLRQHAYTVAWARCLDRIKVPAAFKIIAEIYAPVVSTFIQKLESAHIDLLPGLPSHELPIITVTKDPIDASGGSIFLSLVNESVDATNFVDTHIHPNDNLSIGAAMKSLITGFVDKEALQRKSTALASVDIQLLSAWYQEMAQGENLRLVVFLHDFEKFDQQTVQDMFYICSSTTLPFLFVLLLSGPSSSNYLQKTLPHSTLKLLRPYHLEVPGGRTVLDSILFGVFFNPAFDATLFPGPQLLERYFGKNAIVSLNLQQIAYLHHFSTIKFSLLAQTTPPLLFETSTVFARDLLDRYSAGKFSTKQKEDWRNCSSSLAALIGAIDDIRDSASRKVTDIKLAFSLLHLVITFLRSRPDKSIERWRGAARMSRALTEGHAVAGLLQ